MKRTGLVFRLGDSIETWLPELANRRVLKSIASELDDAETAHRPITVRDVLTYRMGFGCVMAMPDTYPSQRAVRELLIGGDGPPLRWHNSVQRSRGAIDWHSVHAAHDGFASATESIFRFLDAGVRCNEVEVEDTRRPPRTCGLKHFSCNCIKQSHQPDH